MQCECRSSVSGSVLRKNDVLAVSQNQMAISLSGNLLSSSQNFLKRTWHSVGTVYETDTESGVRERGIALTRSDVRINSEANQLSSLLAEVIQI